MKLHVYQNKCILGNNYLYDVLTILRIKNVILCQSSSIQKTVELNSYSFYLTIFRNLKSILAIF